MDLKLEDVAELLNVSKTTIRRWLKKGTIPAYQLNRQYRFNKGEIENWMMTCKLERSEAAPVGEKQIYPVVGRQAFSLYRAMNKGGVLNDVSGKNKEEIIRIVVEKIASRLSLDAGMITDLLLDREEMMSTGIDNGIAVPHPRDSVIKVVGGDAIVTVFLKKPVEYGALDGKPVHTLFFLFSSSDKSHLHLLSKIAHLSSQKHLSDLLKLQPKQDVLLAAVKEWEGKIHNQNV
jgi:PTS system nitrogen regulatory IIA component